MHFKQLGALLVTATLAQGGVDCHAAHKSETLISLPRGTVEGFLGNGLHYLILPNALPRHTVELRLVMRTGSLQEDERQKGGAHFLEHLAFGGTRHFPENQWVDYFERKGMKYGRDINAFTGFDRTIYWLTLPDTTKMDTTLLAVRDVLEGISFEPQRMERERGVIKEELRGYTTGDDFYSLKISNGRHAHRMPLGTESDIDTLHRADLLRYYADWYAPCNTTLVVVGNVDARDTERRIGQLFGTMGKAGKKAGAIVPLEYGKGIHLKEMADTISGRFKLELIIPHPCTVGNTAEQTAAKERERLLSRLLNNRLAARDIHCDISDQWYLADKNHFVIATEGEDKAMLKSRLTAALTELHHISRHGFDSQELADGIRQATEKLAIDTTETTLSSKWCDDFIDYIIAGDRYISHLEDMEKVKTLVGETTNGQLQSMLRAILKAGDATLLTAYQNGNADSDSLSTQEIASIWHQGKKEKATPYTYHPRKHKEENHINIPTILTEKHGNDSHCIASIRHYEELGLTEFTLHNGLRLLVRPTIDNDSTVYLALTGRGGLGDLDATRYRRLKDAAGYVEMGGLEKIAGDALPEVMMQENLSMSVGIDNHWHQVLASAPASKALELFNLVYEKMTAPGQDREGFEATRQEELERLGKETLLERLMKHDADRMLSLCVDSLMGNSLHGDYALPPTKEDIEALNLDSMTAYYKQLFANPAQATLILTGNFRGHDIASEAIATFGRLSADSTLLYNNGYDEKRLAPYTERFEGDNDTQVTLNYIYPGHYEPGLRQSLILKLMRDVIQQRLLSELRERLNIVYSPYADLYYEGLPQRKYYFWLTVAVKKENRAKAEDAMKALLAELRTTPISTAELEKMKMSFIVTKRKSLSDDAPTEWKTALTNLIRNGESIDDFNRYDEVLRCITPDDLREAFSQLVKDESLQLLIKE